MKLTTESGFDKLIADIENLRRLPKDGGGWAAKSAVRHKDNYIENLETQGRPGGEGPAVSKFTRENPSDGSGIRDWVEVVSNRNPRGGTAACGIANEKAAMIARVQDQGTTVVVTESMRDYFASRGATPPPVGSIIEIPGRRSWERAIAQSKKEALSDLEWIWEGYQRGNH
jgi:hypothetical protein